MFLLFFALHFVIAFFAYQLRSQTFPTLSYLGRTAAVVPKHTLVYEIHPGLF